MRRVEMWFQYHGTPTDHFASHKTIIQTLNSYRSIVLMFYCRRTIIDIAMATHVDIYYLIREGFK